VGDYTDEQAYEQAVVRWGPKAVVSVQATWTEDGMTFAFFVGRRAHDAWLWRCYGQGRSWAAAFRDADATERRAVRR
jgi:hypothetical protein